MSLRSDEAWRALAACTDTDTHLLPHGLPHDVAERLTWEAQAVCRACPVLIECRYWALHAMLPVAGVVGGFTEAMRRSWQLDVLGHAAPEVVSAAEFLADAIARRPQAKKERSA